MKRTIILTVFILFIFISVPLLAGADINSQGTNLQDVQL